MRLEQMETGKGESTTREEKEAMLWGHDLRTDFVERLIQAAESWVANMAQARIVYQNCLRILVVKMTEL